MTTHPLITKESTLEQDFQQVSAAEIDYQFHANKERGYNFKAADAARTEFYTVAALFMDKHGKVWTECKPVPKEKHFVFPKKAPENKANPIPEKVSEPVKTIKVQQSEPLPITIAAIAPAAGHNNPPTDTPEEEFRRRMADENHELIATAERLAGAKAKPCDTEEYAERLTNYIKKLNQSTADLEKLRVKEKEPHLKMERVIDDFFKNIKFKLQRAKESAQAPLTKYLNEKVAKEQEARRLAAEELHREAVSQKVAQVALYDAGRPMEAGEAGRAAVKIERHADNLAVTATQSNAAVAQIRGGVASASLRKKVETVISDRNALDLKLIAPFISADALLAAVKLYLSANKGATLAGVTVIETTEAAVR